MNKKGFTLTELLATISIIAVVSLIGAVSITGIKSKIDENMFDSKVQLALGAAKNWGQDNKSSLSATGVERTIKQFINANYLTPDDKTAKDFKNNSGVDVSGKYIVVYLSNNRVYACLRNKSGTTDANNIPTSIFNKYKCS